MVGTNKAVAGVLAVPGGGLLAREQVAHVGWEMLCVKQEWSRVCQQQVEAVHVQDKLSTETLDIVGTLRLMCNSTF